MSVRARILWAMVAIILVMTAAFFVLTRGYMTSLFGKYTVAVRQGEAQQWSAMLSYFYQTNNESWAGVDKYVKSVENQRLTSGRIPGLERLVILDPQNRSVYVSKSERITMNDIMTSGVKVPISDDGKHVGTVYILDRDIRHLSHLQQQILATMAKATAIGAGLTVLAALLVAIWLSSRLTRPLQQLMRAIKQISKGDLRPTLAVKSHDEFGQVAVAFNDMAVHLARVEEARRHLVADVAHELRTPLTIIQGQLELIQQGVQTADPATLLPIQDECMRLTRLVDDLHQLSLAEAGALPLERKPTDIISLVERVVDNFQIEAEEKRLTLSFMSAVPMLLISVDPNRVTQVFINLIGNALRYTPSGGVTHVVVERQPPWVAIRVIDNGPGIEEEHLPNLFDRFYRVESARSRGQGGMGLGLAIAKEFVEAHQGRLTVKSEVDEGTTFTVELPL